MSDEKSIEPGAEQPLSAADLMMQMASSPKPEPAPAPEATTAATAAERQKRIADGLRGNKKMLAGFDEEAQAALGKWTDAAATQIARATEGMNDAEAEDVIQRRVRAMRRLVYGIKDAIVEGGTATPELLDGYYQQAAIAYEGGFQRPGEAATVAFCAEWNASTGTSAEKLTAARRFIESHSGN